MGPKPLFAKGTAWAHTDPIIRAATYRSTPHDRISLHGRVLLSLAIALDHHFQVVQQGARGAPERRCISNKAHKSCIVLDSAFNLRHTTRPSTDIAIANELSHTCETPAGVSGGTADAALTTPL